jgi:hypothetical protein
MVRVVVPELCTIFRDGERLDESVCVTHTEPD